MASAKFSKARQKSLKEYRHRQHFTQFLQGKIHGHSHGIMGYVRNNQVVLHQFHADCGQHI